MTVLNQVVVVGRLSKIFTGQNRILLEVTRSEKSPTESEYTSDLMVVDIPEGIMTKLLGKGVCVGNLIGIKGCLRGLSPTSLLILAEKVTFLGGKESELHDETN